MIVHNHSDMSTVANARSHIQLITHLLQGYSTSHVSGHIHLILAAAAAASSWHLHACLQARLSAQSHLSFAIASWHQSQMAPWCQLQLEVIQTLFAQRYIQAAVLLAASSSGGSSGIHHDLIC